MREVAHGQQPCAPVSAGCEAAKCSTASRRMGAGRARGAGRTQGGRARRPSAEGGVPLRSMSAARQAVHRAGRAVPPRQHRAWAERAHHRPLWAGFANPAANPLWAHVTEGEAGHALSRPSHHASGSARALGLELTCSGAHQRHCGRSGAVCDRSVYNCIKNSRCCVRKRLFAKN